MKHKVVIQIFPMVNEIDYLERTLLLLKQSSVYLDKEKFYIILDITLPTSNYLTDWGNSILKQDYFISKFKNKNSFVYNLSSGHNKHEYTTGCAFKEIFKFFDDNTDSKYI